VQKLASAKINWSRGFISMFICVLSPLAKLRKEVKWLYLKDVIHMLVK